MKYIIDVAGESVEVEIAGGQATLLGVSDAAPRSASLRFVEGSPIALLILGDRVIPVVVQRTGGRGHYKLALSGARSTVQALDERGHAIRAMTAALARDAGPKPLTAPMPGLIVKLLVAVGETVSAGQPLVSMEAMKMENELRSPSSGRVTAVRVEPRQAVEKGAVLVELA